MPKNKPVRPEAPENLVPEKVLEVESPELPQELIPTERDEVPAVSVEEFPDLPQVGDTVTLTKKSINEGARSEFSEGRSFSGALLGSVRVGESMYVGTRQTSPVKAIFREGNGKFRIETGTSVYELALNAVSNGTLAEAIASEKQAEANAEKLPEPPKEGEKVSIQKMPRSAEDQTVVGDMIEGTLLGNLEEGSPIAALTGKDLEFTSNTVTKVYRGGRNKFYAETASGSVYVINRVA